MTTTTIVEIGIAKGRVGSEREANTKDLRNQTHQERGAKQQNWKLVPDHKFPIEF